ncbi:MAG: 50S ribosomal protein L23 [Halobacteriovoraceae bacterium]|nr:50S ribosomal protein L23 [Halobacteriovoraceae bacterium]
MAHLSEVIIKPLLTEKSSNLTDKLNTYCFQVNRKSTKTDIKNAIERFFDVKVKRVTTSTTPGKLRRHGRSIKKTPNVKKAYIQVQDGQKIELFKGI